MSQLLNFVNILEKRIEEIKESFKADGFTWNIESVVREPEIDRSKFLKQSAMWDGYDHEFIKQNQENDMFWGTMYVPLVRLEDYSFVYLEVSFCS